ncbi:MAG: PBP1A family penicillin-binding protein [Parcubacteria group bacterium]
MRTFSPNRNFSAGNKLKFWFSKIKWKLLGKIFLWLILAGFLSVAGIFAYYAKDLPSPGSLNSRTIAQSTKIYDRTGNHLLYEIHGEEKRTEIPFSQMPDSLRYATIALEDQNFYTNHGIEITSIIRAGLADVLHRKATQGASTITQQLVKQTLLTSEKTISRKVKEAILSIELGQKFSKDEILGMYLNQIPYGSNAYGTEAAAQTFFGKHASELTLDESALLASLPQAPSHYSPYGNFTEALKARQEYALDQMARLGYISTDQATEAKQVDVLAKIKPFSESISAPHFVMYVKDYLEKQYGEQAVEQGGLKVYTTLDWDKQQIAEQAVRDYADKNATTYRANNAALVAADPRTGQVLAMVGSKDYFGKATPAGCVSGKNCKFEGNFNVATANRQPGSSFKPYVYLTAFEKGFTPETNIWDVDTNFSTVDGQVYDPKNYDGNNRGLIQMKNALAMSLNVPAVKTLYLAGVNNSIDTAHKMGITTLNDPSRYGLSLVLGGGEVTLLDHVNAYSTFATGGIHHNQTTILKVENGSGKILEEYKPDAGTRAIEEKYIAMIDYILSTNSLRAPVFGENNPLRFDDRPVAAKTGTTNEWRDGWTMGYTPSLVAGVWTGNNDNTVMAKGADGSYVAAPIWREFMQKALQNYTVEQFPKYTAPETGKAVLDGKLDQKMKVSVCKIKKDEYCLANDSCPSDSEEKKSFIDNHSILYYVNKDNPLGDPPSNPKDDPQFSEWEDAVKKYLKDNKVRGDSVPTEACQASDFKDGKSKNKSPSISIESPADGDTLTDTTLSIKINASSPNGAKSVTIAINGTDVYSKANDLSFTFDYPLPDNQKSSTLNIKATVTDNDGDSTSSEINITTNIP